MAFDQQILSLLASDLETHGLAVLAGAGVSLAPPACAPMFRPLRDSLIEGLLNSLSGAVEASLLEKCHSLFDGESDLRRGIEPVPEVLFESIHAILSDRLFDALRILLQLPAPNSNHCFLANLTDHGLRVLITTNFENGFEQALEKLDLPFEVCADGPTISDSISRIVSRKDNKLPLSVWKPHGTLDPGAEESIRITLSQVAKERLDPQKFEPIITVTAEMPLLVVGYSGYDADLSKVLTYAAEHGLRLYWLSYSEPRQDEPSLRIVQSWQDRGHLLIGDMAEFFKELSNFVPNLQVYEHPSNQCAEEWVKRLKELEQWIESISVEDRLWALVSVCWKLSEYEPALALVGVIEELAVKKEDGASLINCLLRKTNIFRSAGRDGEVGPVLYQLCELRKQIGPPDDPKLNWLDAMLFHEEGEYFRAHGEKNDAKESFQLALRLFHSYGDTESNVMVCQSLGALHSHHHEFQEAKELFELALQGSLETGIRDAELKARHELGIIALEEDDYEAASAFFADNVRQAHEIGAVDIEANGMQELANLATAQKNYKEATRLLTEVQRLARLIGNKKTELFALLGRGKIEVANKRSHAAIKLLTHCVEGAVKLGNGAIEANARSFRAASYADLREFEKARADIEHARTLAEHWDPVLIPRLVAFSGGLDRWMSSSEEQ